MKNITEGENATVDVPVESAETSVTTVAPLYADQFDIKRLPIDSLMDSPTNPSRRSERPSEKFINSIREKGVLQPILVRPIENVNHPQFHYEIVYGHRRVAGSRIVGYVDIPATIRSLTDQEVIEIQVIENVQREDIHPIEEGEGYKRLIDEFSYSVEEIERKTGISRSTIYERLKLCDLEKTVRKAAFDGVISGSVAFLISRIPNKSAHPEALKGLIEMAKNDMGRFVGRRRSEEDGDDNETPEITYRAAAKFIKENYMLDLREAPFPIDDAELVKAAGPCGTCPKKTGNQSHLFGDVTNKELCTDSKCYKNKLAAYNKVFESESKEKGYRWVPAKELKTIYMYGNSHPSNNWIDLDSVNYSDSKSRTWNQIIGKLITPDVVSACINTEGKPTLLINNKDAEKIVKKGIKTGEVKGVRDSRDYGGGSRAPRSDGTSKWETEQRHKKAVEHKLWEHLRDVVVPDLIKSQLIKDRFPEIAPPMRAAMGILLSGSIYRDQVKADTPSAYVWHLLDLDKDDNTDKKKKRDPEGDADLVMKAAMKVPASDLFAAVLVSGCDGFVDYKGNITDQIECIFGLSDAAIKPEKIKVAAIVESDKAFTQAKEAKKEKQQLKDSKSKGKKDKKSKDTETDEQAAAQAIADIDAGDDDGNSDPLPDDAEGSDIDDIDNKSCRVCGCTFSTPCEGGCSWVEADLCSKCADAPAKPAKANKEKKPKATKEPKAKVVKAPKPANPPKAPKAKKAKK